MAAIRDTCTLSFLEFRFIIQRKTSIFSGDRLSPSAANIAIILYAMCILLINAFDVSGSINSTVWFLPCKQGLLRWLVQPCRFMSTGQMTQINWAGLCPPNFLLENSPVRFLLPILSEIPSTNSRAGGAVFPNRWCLSLFCGLVGSVRITICSNSISFGGCFFYHFNRKMA